MLYSLFRTHAQQHPDKAAIVYEGESITYAEMCARIERSAGALRARGVTPGAVVATCYGNDIDNLVLLFALARAGARLVTLDVASTEHELAQIMADCRPSWIVTEQAHFDKIEAAANATVADATIVSERTASIRLADLLTPREDHRDALEDREWSDDFILQYTSGSTGKPKGVMQSQRGLCNRLRNWMDTARLNADDSHLCILTLSHGYGSHCVALPALCSGGTLHMFDLRRVSPQRVLRYLERHRVTCFYALPFFYQLMAQIPKRVSCDLSALRMSMVGSAPVAPGTLAQFYDRFGITLNNTYGLSEIGIITSDLRPGPRCPDGTIGALVKGIEARLEPVEDDAGDGDVGELVVRSDSMAEGYFAPEDGPMLRDGWLYTKDLVRRDEGGNYYLIGRTSQFINVAGNKVMPLEIEEVVQEVPGVREVAVVGVGDPLLGQRPAAFVVAEPGVSAGTIHEHCRDKLAGFKVPDHIYFRASLPKSPAGKILKSKLDPAQGSEQASAGD
ncbi:class I adenylate-forming enzyme family protein [Haliangium sp.]|uniref:class I adenylate-forming enzyme family protein n=1 Tax=Haliangium sp. TaxID=2663208 RepID=UPI003D0C3844